MTGDEVGAFISYLEVAETRREEMLAAAWEAQSFAYAPYSNFAVGAAVLLSDGSISKGCNIENASFGLTVCAERVALFEAISRGRLDIAAIAVVTSSQTLCKPCGACRQVIAEFSQAGNPIAVLCATRSGKLSLETISDLLPDTFTLI